MTRVVFVKEPPRFKHFFWPGLAFFYTIYSDEHSEKESPCRASPTRTIWSGPGSYNRENVDIASRGALYRFTHNEGYERMDYEPAGIGTLRCTDGCGCVGWPGDPSRVEHERALPLIALKVMPEGIPAKLVISEFSKIPASRSMKARHPKDVFGKLVA